VLQIFGKKDQKNKILYVVAEDESGIGAEERARKEKPKCADGSKPTCPATCPNGSAPPCKKVATIIKKKIKFSSICPNGSLPPCGPVTLSQ
jgi:hypothetical protein